MSRPALGLIETEGLTGAIQATHAATRAGEVVIASAERTDAGRITVKIEGDWGAVQAAVEAGARAADQAGELVSMHVIPRPDNAISSILPYRSFIDRYRSEQVASKPPLPPKPRLKKARAPKQTVATTVRPTPSKPAPAEPVKPSVSPRPLQSEPSASMLAGSKVEPEQLEAMSVVKLRKYARGMPNLPIQGRQISIANKQQLLKAIQNAGEKQPE
jgi:microcompartment protein CcmL/EutN